MEPVSIAAMAFVALATAYAFVRKALLSLVYAVTFLAVYVLQVISGRSVALLSPIVFELGLVYGPGFLPAPWTWITYAFVHASPGHLFLNVLGLVFISPILEGRIASGRWLVLFSLGAVFGAGVFLLTRFADIVLLVGGSAGISSVFGAFGRLYPRERLRLFLPLPGVPAIQVIHLVIGFLILETALAIIGPTGVAWEAHAAAMGFGFAVAPAVMRVPLAGGRTRRLAPVESLRALATTPELAKIYEEAERADVPEARDAWIEKFIATARCPRCGGPLRRRHGRVTSDCGWRKSI